MLDNTVTSSTAIKSSDALVIRPEDRGGRTVSH